MKKLYLSNTDRKLGGVCGGIGAMDSVRTALRLGADNAYIICRRSEIKLPATKEEVHHAHEEGGTVSAAAVRRPLKPVAI